MKGQDGTYALYANGELWKTGKHAYRAGYMMSQDEDSMSSAIDEHEEEMAAMIAEFQQI